MRFARRVFTIAGGLGLLMLLPMYALEAQIGRDMPPAITHPEHYYGFIGVAVAWQVAFLIIGRDPIRYRPLMLAAMLEKATFVGAVLALFAAGRVATPILAAAAVDLAFGVLFVLAYRATAPGRRGRADRIARHRQAGGGPTRKGGHRGLTPAAWRPGTIPDRLPDAPGADAETVPMRTEQAGPDVERRWASASPSAQEGRAPSLPGRLAALALGRLAALVPAAIVVLVPLVVVPLASTLVRIPDEDQGRYPVWAVEAFGAELLNAALAAVRLPLPALLLYGALPVAVPFAAAVVGLGTVGRWAALGGGCLVAAGLLGFLAIGLLLDLVLPVRDVAAIRLEVGVALAWPLLGVQAVGCLLAASVAPTGRS